MWGNPDGSSFHRESRAPKDDDLRLRAQADAIAQAFLQCVESEARKLPQWLEPAGNSSAHLGEQAAMTASNGRTP